MKYLKYFESASEKIWKRIDDEEAHFYKKNNDLLKVTKLEFNRFIDIVGYNHNLNISIIDDDKIHVMTNTVFGYTIYLFTDEYFIIREDRYRSTSPHSLSIGYKYFLVDGWDGLDQIVSILISAKKMS